MYFDYGKGYTVIFTGEITKMDYRISLNLITCLETIGGNGQYEWLQDNDYHIEFFHNFPEVYNVQCVCVGNGATTPTFHDVMYLDGA